jgi:hypothetical protein
MIILLEDEEAEKKEINSSNKKPRAQRKLGPEFILTGMMTVVNHDGNTDSSRMMVGGVISQDELYNILCSEVVPSKWRKDPDFIKLLYSMALRGEIAAGSKLVMVVDFSNCMPGSDPSAGAVLFKCSMCSYMGDRYYHTKKHFQRVHVMNGRAMHRKRKFDFAIAKDDLPYVSSPFFNRKMPIVRETWIRKKKRQQHLLNKKKEGGNDHEGCKDYQIGEVEYKEEEEEETEEEDQNKDVDDDEWHMDCEKKSKKKPFGVVVAGAAVNKRKTKNNDHDNGEQREKQQPASAVVQRTEKRGHRKTQAKSSSSLSSGGWQQQQQLLLDSKDAFSSLYGCSSSSSLNERMGWQGCMAFVGDFYEGARRWNEIGAGLFAGGVRRKMMTKGEVQMESPEKRRGVFFRVVDRISTLQKPSLQEKQHDTTILPSHSREEEEEEEHGVDVEDENNELFFLEACQEEQAAIQEDEEEQQQGQGWYDWAGGDDCVFFSV